MKKNRLQYVRVFSLIVLVFALACSTQEQRPETKEVKKSEPQKASELDIKEFREAEAAYKARKNVVAIKKLSAFIQRHPRLDLTNDAAYDLAQLYHDQADHFKAAKYWLFIVDSTTLSRHYDRAALYAGQSLFQLGRLDEALNTLARIHISDQTEKAVAAQTLDLSAKLKLQKGNGFGAIQDYLSEIDFKATLAEKQQLMARSSEIINGNLPPAQLAQIANSNQFRGLEPLALFRLATSQYEQKNWPGAREQFNAVIQKYPGTDQANKAQQYLSVIDAQERTDATVVGVILPLSGKYSQMGYKTLRGIQMGMGLFKKSSSSPLKLAIIDSEGNPDVARRGVDKLVSEDHVVAIIGDIVSKTAQAVSSKAQELGVPNLTLSQKKGLNEIGDFIFRSILTPELQMKALVDVAVNQLGYKRFAIMYSNDSYGTEYASTFWDYVLLKGGQVTAVQTYQPDETDFRDPVRRLIGTYFGEDDRGRELQLRLADWKKQQAQKNSREKPPKDLLPPLVDFDALFIPDGPKAIGQLAPMLAYNDVSKMALLGTNIWDTPQILTRGGKFVEKSVFIDDFFVEDPSPSMKRFVSEFQSQFNYKPDVFEAHGYDSAVLIAHALAAGNYNMSRIVLRDRLSNPAPVEGATGALKMTSLREIDKTLIPLTVSKGQIVKLETGTSAQ